MFLVQEFKLCLKVQLPGIHLWIHVSSTHEAINDFVKKNWREREREINEPNDKELKRIYDEHDDDDDDSSDGDDDDSSDDDDEISVIYNRKPCRNKQMSAVAL